MTHLVQVDGSLPENKWALLHNVLKAWPAAAMACRNRVAAELREALQTVDGRPLYWVTSCIRRVDHRCKQDCCAGQHSPAQSGGMSNPAASPGCDLR